LAILPIANLLARPHHRVLLFVRAVAALPRRAASGHAFARSILSLSLGERRAAAIIR